MARDPLIIEELTELLTEIAGPGWQHLEEVIEEARRIGKEFERKGRIPGFVLEFRSSDKTLRFHISEERGTEEIVIRLGSVR